MVAIKEDEKGYILFINHDTIDGNGGSLDHPKFSELFETLNEKHSQTKYFTYRCSGKLFEIQNILQTNRIPYQLVLGILDRHRMQNTSSLTPIKMKDVVFDVYYAAYRLGYFLEDDAVLDLEMCKYVLLNLVWNIFDPKRNKVSVDILAFRQLMLLLCESSCFESKLFEYFDIVCDHNQLLPRSKFESMLLYFGKIFAYIDESANQFGSNWITNTVRDTYEHCPGPSGLTQLQFFGLWSAANSNFANFSNIIALLQRLNQSQYVIHQKRCAGCALYPIRGLRFKCKKCENFSLCLKCFSIGFSTKKHSTGHKMYEISNSLAQANHVSKFFFKFCICSKSNTHEFDTTLANKEIKLVETHDVGGETNTSTVKITSHSTMKRATINKSLMSGYFNGQQTLSRGSTQAGKLIKVLEALVEEHEIFQNNINMFKPHLKEDQLQILQRHIEILGEQIKDLRDCAQTSFTPFSSTPFRATVHKKRTPLLNGLNGSVPLFNSIHGMEFNRTYLEENKSLSINDISNWFQIDENKNANNNATKNVPERDMTLTKVDTKMVNFKRLLEQVREIVDDSYSDNGILKEKTKNLELELDQIIAEETEKRS